MKIYQINIFFNFLSQYCKDELLTLQLAQVLSKTATALGQKLVLSFEKQP